MVIYTLGRDSHNLRRLTMVNDLRVALEEGGLDVAFGDSGTRDCSGG